MFGRCSRPRTTSKGIDSGSGFTARGTTSRMRRATSRRRRCVSCARSAPGTAQAAAPAPDGRLQLPSVPEQGNRSARARVRMAERGFVNLDRVKQALWDAFDGTAQPTTLNGLRLHLDEVGWQVDTSRFTGYQGRENVPVTDELTRRRSTATSSVCPPATRTSTRCLRLPRRRPAHRLPGRRSSGRRHASAGRGCCSSGNRRDRFGLARRSECLEPARMSSAPMQSSASRRAG